MRNFLPTLLTGALFCAAAFAQSENPSYPTGTAPQGQAQPIPQSEAQAQQPAPQAAPNSAPAPTAANRSQTSNAPRIAPGSVIPVELTKTIDAKKAKPGDQIVAKVTMDMKTNSGEVLVPKDTKVVGHVTEAQARTKEQKESQIGIAFDHAVFKTGDVSLPMSIQAVIAPPSNSGNNGGGSGEPTAPSTGGSTATSPMGGSGRNSPTGGGAQAQPSTTPSSASPAEGTGTDAQQQGSGGRPPINGNTQGVVGISNLKLEASQNATQGSVLSSEKNNVKVESGTMLLLRVNQ